MPKISDEAIAGYAYQAGVRGTQLELAVAIALAESGGNTEAHNAKPPDDSYGLWQINMLGAMGPARRLQFGLQSNADLFDPAKNAKAMFALSGGGRNWTAWTTYTRGNYKAHLNAGANAVSALNQRIGGGGNPLDKLKSFLMDKAQSGALPNAVAGIPGVQGIANLGEFFGKVMDPETWKRVALFVVGFAFIIFALFKLTGNNKLEEKTKTIAKIGAAVVTKKIPAKLGNVAKGASAVAAVKGAKSKPGGGASLRAGASVAGKGKV